MSRKSSIKVRMYRYFLLGLAIALPIFLIRRPDLMIPLKKTVQESNWKLVVAAGLLNSIFITFSRAKRFSVLIYQAVPKEKQKTTLFNLITVMTASRAISLIFPAKSGELLRAVQLHNKFGYHPESVIAVIFIEALFDIISLGFLALLVTLLGFTTQSFNFMIYPIIGIGVLGILFMMLINRRGPLEKLNFSNQSHSTTDQSPRRLIVNFLDQLRKRVFRIWHSIHLINSPTIWLRALSWTWLTDLVDVLMIGLCLKAVNIHLSIAHWFLILVVINIAILLPVPGNIGTLEAGALLILGALGVSKGEALGFALLYHSAHLFPVIILGSISLYFESHIQ